MRTDQQSIKAISWTWGEGKYWDLWMLVHISWGVIIACIMNFLFLQTVPAYLIALGAMIAWKTYELLTGIKEELTNLILDIVFEFFGFIGVYEYILPFISLTERIIFLTTIFIIMIILEVIGWRAYRKRVSGNL